jgi:hypothetical protein
MDAFASTEAGRKGRDFVERLAAHLADEVRFVRAGTIVDAVPPGYAVVLDLPAEEVPAEGVLADLAGRLSADGFREMPEDTYLRLMVVAEDRRDSEFGMLGLRVRAAVAASPDAPAGAWDEFIDTEFTRASDLSDMKFAIILDGIKRGFPPLAAPAPTR